MKVDVCGACLLDPGLENLVVDREWERVAFSTMPVEHQLRLRHLQIKIYTTITIDHTADRYS